VGHDAGERILAGHIQRGDTSLIHAVIWFSDLRGFTSMSTTLPPQDIIRVLNDVFDCQVPSIEKHGGQVLKFMGDGLLAIFPVVDANAPARCAAAIEAARDAFAALETLNAQRKARGEPDVRFGIGLHIGEFAYGNIGGSGRLDTFASSSSGARGFRFIVLSSNTSTGGDSLRRLNNASGSSTDNAIFKTSSTCSTGMNFSFFFTRSGMSARSPSLSFGMMTILQPALCAASDFSFRPPIAITRPRSVISPVIAMSCFTATLVSADTSEVAIVTPADGPSLGVAPSGTWMWTSMRS
jgi:hypothetical protein